MHVRLLLLLCLYILTVNTALLVAHLPESRQSILTGMLLSKVPANCVNCMHFLIGSAEENVFFPMDLAYITLSYCH